MPYIEDERGKRRKRHGSEYSEGYSDEDSASEGMLAGKSFER